MKSLGKEKNLLPQYIQQSYMIERFLLKLSKSRYQDMFIVKGGFLIGGMIGVGNRATMDLDTTIRGFDLTIENLDAIIPEIIKIPTDEQFEFDYLGADNIREGDDYPGYKVKFQGRFERLNIPFSIDVTTGDKITPSDVAFEFPMLFEDKLILLRAYNLETILAEKLETVVSRGDTSTRPRDYYDLYILSHLFQDKIDFGILRDALAATASKRQSRHMFDDYKNRLDKVIHSNDQLTLWEKYQERYPYARDISFESAVRAAIELLDTLNLSEAK
jgi:predicted nucleotidyltransferase component of viral defense system